MKQVFWIGPGDEAVIFRAGPMSATPSTMLAIGTPMPAFQLPDYNGRLVSSQDFASAPALLVAFICPHCPFVRHIRAGLATFTTEYLARGLAIVGINSNDVRAFPQDDPAGMRREAQSMGYGFPYLFDETQQVAKDFHAACTPDLFLFDRSRRLVYRGQFDDSRPGGSIAVTGRDIREAADAVLAGLPITGPQRASIGCNIKWKPGNEPAYV
jgi:peroxiredoxin